MPARALGHLPGGRLVTKVAGYSALGPLPISKGRVWYRVHYTPRQWNHGVGPDASSSRFRWDFERQQPDFMEFDRTPGYSAFDNPRDLKRYMDERWDPARLRDNKHRVVIFTGNQIGMGADDEPL